MGNIKLILTAKDSNGNRVDITKRFKRLYTSLLMFAILLYLVFLALFSSLALRTDQDKYVRKQPLKESICSVIKKGGDLNLVKHIYNTRTIESIPFPHFKKDISVYYSSDYPLSFVLNDLLRDYLASNPFVPDSLYHHRLLLLIEENDYHFPFDNLEETQRYYFENLRLKSGEEYETIQSDVIKIADEIHNKNQLVEKYLGKSNISFIISIIALVLTLGFSLFQIIQNRASLKMMLSAIVEKKDDIETEKTTQ